MKKFGTILLALVMVFALAACAAGTESTESSDSAVSSQSSLEASRTSAEPQEENASETPSEAGNESDASGEAPSEPTDSTESSPVQEPEGSKILVAYFSATGNTEGVAQKLADGLDADLYEITPEQPYTDADLNYNNSGSRSSVEMNDPSARPAISGSVENMDQYDVVFVGYPIWWGEAPRIMSTFIESYDFSGKTLVAFCTSASSGFGSSDKGINWSIGIETPVPVNPAQGVSTSSRLMRDSGSQQGGSKGEHNE